jgi:hypothetical protein
MGRKDTVLADFERETAHYDTRTAQNPIGIETYSGSRKLVSETGSQ